MSFLDDIVDVGSSVWDWATGSSMSAGVARAAALGYMLKEVQASINKDNEKGTTSSDTGGGGTSTLDKDYGVREQIDPDTNNTIPVLYGQAFLTGSIVDAVLSEDNQTMWYCIALCEKTGPLLSTYTAGSGFATDSFISFEAMYWNESKVNFRADGITATSLSDEDGNTSNDIDGLVEVYLYNNGSDSPAKFSSLSAPAAIPPAYNLFPNWTTSHKMTNLVFAIVKVTYNKSKNITGLGNIQFKLKNTLTQPGDVIFDYLTNSIYGANIPFEEIYSE